MADFFAQYPVTGSGGGGGSGTVTSVDLSMPVEFTVSGNPITTAGTISVVKANESANKVWAGPTTGSAAQPAFRSLVTADLPAGVGSVTSVAMTVPTGFTISGSPITSSGTLALGLSTETANTVWAGPTSGGAANPTFRALVAADMPTNAQKRSVGCNFDGAGFVLVAGKVIYLSNIPYGGTITGVTMLADVSGSATVDIWKVAYASAPPTVANTIVASAIPTLSSAQKSQDNTLTGWTVAVSAGDTMAFKLVTSSTITFLSLTLQITAT